MDYRVEPHVEVTQGEELGQVEQAGTNILMSTERVPDLYDLISELAL